MKILILAAGKLKMWAGDQSRHLVSIAGEPLLVRTLRELAERGHDATVVTDDLEIIEMIPGCFVPEEASAVWCTMLSTKELWRGKVLVMLGDVFYRDDMYDMMLNYVGETPACFDSFACLWDEKDYDYVTDALERLGMRKPFNLLWREGFFPRIPHQGHKDFDVVAYYEQFLGANPWAR